MATPSSKQNLGATPTHLTSSPRPSAVPMTRPLSHRSPSIRTPSASGHGHGHQPSNSSHQYATPLGANINLDDPVAFNSPSALLAFGAYAGISPSATHDGLGTAMNESDIHALGLGLGAPRDNEEERRRHIEEVVQLLRTRIAGRGVCREAIERLVQLEGFDSIWQGKNNLSIAGNSVDLDIEFNPGQETVKDVTLKYTTPEAQDGEGRDEATAVLKRDLILSSEEQARGIWKPLDGFHGNLERLAKLDRLSQEVNCFEAVEGLYESLRRVWEEETKRRRDGRIYEHLCRGCVGRPGLHRGRRIGLGLDYWVEQHRVLDAKSKGRLLGDIAPEQSVNGSIDEELKDQLKVRSVIIECEVGYPSLRVSKDWVGSEVLTAVDASGSSNGGAESEIMLVNWADPPSTIIPSIHSNQPDPMALNPEILGSASPNRRFVAKLEPPIDVPFLAATDIYRHLGLQPQHEYKMVSYDGLLVQNWMSSQDGERALEGLQQVNVRRRKKSVITFDLDGHPVRKQHSYTFQAFDYPSAGLTLRDLPFSHPRQLADIFPILRQYGLLASLIQKVFQPPGSDGGMAPLEEPSKPNKNARAETSIFSRTSKKSSRLLVLSNDDPNETFIHTLLNPNIGTGAGLSENELPKKDAEVRIDITLRTQVGQPPLIMVLFAVINKDLSLQSEIWQVSVNFEVRLNGRIAVTHVAGLWGENSHVDSSSNLEEQLRTGPRPEVREMQARLSRVLETSEDIGILVEWILQRFPKKQCA